MNLFYTLGILIVLFAGFNFLINAQPIGDANYNYMNDTITDDSFNIVSLKGLVSAFTIDVGNDFINSLITGLQILLVIALILYARGLL